MKLFLTGATGYLGHKIAFAAIRKNYKVHALVTDLHCAGVPLHPDITLFKGDITDQRSIEAAMAGCEKVIHSAGITKLRSKDRDQFYEVNVQGTLNVLETAYRNNIKKMVFTSSCAVLGPSPNMPLHENDPRINAFENDYEISKHWAEQLVKEYSRKGLFTLIVSPSRIYGSGNFTSGNSITMHVQKIMKNKIAIIPGDGKICGNYAFVEDVVNGHFLAMDRGIGGERYILGGENISYESFFKTIQQLSPKRIRCINVPGNILRAWSFFNSAICSVRNKESDLSVKIINRFFQNRTVSCEKAIRQLGYTITPFREGMARTIKDLQLI